MRKQYYPTDYEEAKRLIEGLSLEEKVRLCREIRDASTAKILAIIEDANHLQVDRILSALAEKVQGADPRHRTHRGG